MTTISAWDISPDGEWALWAADERERFRTELCARRIDGSGSTLVLSGPMITGGSLSPEPSLSGRLVLGPTHAVYRADQDTDGVVEIYSSPLPELH
jgi:hypothetical protein